MARKTIETIYEESWKMHIERGKAYPTQKNKFGSAIAELVGTNAKVLDIGCGSGKCILPVAAKGNDVVGVDVSDEALKIVRELGFKGLKFNIEDEPIDILREFGPFDVILMTDILEHLIDPIPVLREKVYPLLKPSGLCIATVPNFVYLSYRLEFLQGKISHFNNNSDVTSHAIPRPYNLGHKTLFNRENLFQTFELSGFSKVRVTPELFSESLNGFWRNKGLRNFRDMLKQIWPTLLAARFLVLAEK